MLIREEALRQAELAILNAPFDDGGWSAAIAAMARATGCGGGHLLGMGGPLILPLNIVAGLDSRIERYLGDPHLHGSVNWRVGVSTTPMSIQHDWDYARYRAANDTADYDDAASDLDIQFGCQSVILSDSSAFLGIALMRGRRHGPCSAETLAAFRTLLRPLQRAVRMQIALDGEAAELMLGETGELHGATVLLDRLGAVAALTPAAEEAFEEDGPLCLSGLGLRLRQASADRVLQKAMAHLLASADGASLPVHQMRVPAGERRWEISVMRLPEREHGLGFDPHLAIALKRLG